MPLEYMKGIKMSGNLMDMNTTTTAEEVYFTSRTTEVTFSEDFQKVIQN